MKKGNLYFMRALLYTSLALTMGSYYQTCSYVERKLTEIENMGLEMRELYERSGLGPIELKVKELKTNVKGVQQLNRRMGQLEGKVERLNIQMETIKQLHEIREKIEGLPMKPLV